MLPPDSLLFRKLEEAPRHRLCRVLRQGHHARFRKVTIVVLLQCSLSRSGGLCSSAGRLRIRLLPHRGCRARARMRWLSKVDQNTHHDTV